MSNREQIVLKLQNLRGKWNMSFEMPMADSVNSDFYKLAIYCFTNFPVPESHQEYIDRELEVSFTKESKRHSLFFFFGKKNKEPRFFSKENAKDIVSLDGMINQLIAKWSNSKEGFCLEMPLRAIEVLFNYGHFIVDDQQCEFVFKLINSLESRIKLYQDNLAA